MSISLPETQKRINELNRQDEARLAENKRLNEIARQERLAREHESLGIRNAEREEQRLKAEEKLKADLRTNYMAGNPSASDKDFERVYLELKDARMIANALREEEEQLASARRSYNLL